MESEYFIMVVHAGPAAVTFKKVANIADRVSDAEAVNLLGQLEHFPSEFALRRLARILPQGSYHLAMIEAPVRLVEPGTPEDYFATEVVHLFGLDPPEYEKPEDPGTRYYRLGSNHELTVSFSGEAIRPGSELASPSSGEGTKTLLTQIAMPLQDPATLDRARVEYWKSSARAGHPLTAFAVSLLDNQRQPRTTAIGITRTMAKCY
jgi:hypothetical protein